MKLIFNRFYNPTNIYFTGLSNEYVPLVTSPSSSSSGTSNDSDIQVVDETIDASRLNTEMPRVGPHTVEMPGMWPEDTYVYIV